MNGPDEVLNRTVRVVFVYSYRWLNIGKIPPERCVAMSDENVTPEVDETPIEDVNDEDSSPSTEDDETVDSSPTDDPEPERPLRNNKIERRMSEYARKVHALEAEVNALRNPAPPLVAEKAPEKPDPDAFDSHEEYLEALTEFKADQKIKAVFDARDRAEQDRKSKAERDTRNQSAAEKLEAGHVKYGKDFDLVYETEVDGRVVDEIEDSPMYADLAMHLAKNPDEVKRLESLSGKALTREIAKLEMKLEGVVAKPPRITNHNKPVRSVDNTGGGGAPKHGLTADSPMEEYEKALGYRG